MQRTGITLKYYVTQADTKDFSGDSDSSFIAGHMLDYTRLDSESQFTALPLTSWVISLICSKLQFSHLENGTTMSLWWGINEQTYEDSWNQKLVLSDGPLGRVKAVTDMQPWVPAVYTDS